VISESRALVRYFSELLRNDSELLGRGKPVWLSVINPRCRAIRKFGASPAPSAEDPHREVHLDHLSLLSRPSRGGVCRDSGNNDAFGDAVMRLTGILEPRPEECLNDSAGSRS